MAALKPKRGEVWWVCFDPSQGTEVNKERPAIVLSNNISNQHLDRCQVVPLTSSVERVYVSECVVQVRGRVGKAMADQLRTVSIARFRSKLGRLSTPDLLKVESIVRLQLGLD